MGKTHLAIAITMAMIEQDLACRFFPATALVQLLQKAKASFELPDLIQKQDRHLLLVIDDNRSRKPRATAKAAQRAGNLSAV